MSPDDEDMLDSREVKKNQSILIFWIIIALSYFKIVKYLNFWKLRYFDFSEFLRSQGCCDSDFILTNYRTQKIKILSFLTFRLNTYES